jgi:hypothetical protein
MSRLNEFLPGVPADRSHVLRSAFDAATKDPEFLAEAKSLNLDVDPVGATEIDALLKTIYASPPEIAKLASELVRDTP